MQKIPTDNFQFNVVNLNGVKSIQLFSRPYYQHWLNNNTKEGDIGTMQLTLKKPSRSGAQLRYYAVIVGLIGENTGHTWEEVHESLMVLKFGTTKIKIGKDLVDVRKSVSDRARLPKGDMVELIEFALQKAAELEIKVPTRTELGYISN